nr:hypothetical protein [Tanacetum cinerariifolium]
MEVESVKLVNKITSGSKKRSHASKGEVDQSTFQGKTLITFEDTLDWDIVFCTGPKKSDICNNCLSTMAYVESVVLPACQAKLKLEAQVKSLEEIFSRVTAEKRKSFKVLMDNEVLAVKMHNDEVNVLEDQIVKL